MNFIIIAQITSIISWFLFIYSYYKDDIDELLSIQVIASFFDCLSYFFLGAWTGLFVSFIELLKGVGYYKTDKDNLIFWLTLPMYIIMAIFTYDTIFSLLPVIASIIDGFSLTKNKKIATIGCIISSLLWVIYDFIVLAYASVLADSVLIISNISILVLGYSILLKSNKLRILKGKSLTRNLYNAIYELDEKNYGIEYTWPFNYEKNIYSKNENSIMIIKSDKEIVGYFNYLIINEEEYLKIINSSESIKEYDLNNVISLHKTKKNYLIIDSINIKSKFHNPVTIKLIVKKIKQFVLKNYRDNYKISSIVSVAVNQFEKDVLEKAGFSVIKEYSKKEILYGIDENTIKELYLKEEKKDYYNYKVYENKEITPEMIQELGELDKKFFKEEYLWNKDYQLQVFNKNKNSLIIIKYKNQFIGYLNYLVITKEKYDEMINSNVIVDEFNLDEIITFHKTKKNYITLNSVVIDKKFQNGYAVRLLTRRLKKILKQMNYNKYKIEGINAFAVSKDGRHFLENIGFKKIKELEDKNCLYILDEKNLKTYLK